MLEKEESLPALLEPNPDEERYIDPALAENEFNKEIDKNKCDKFNSTEDFAEKIDKLNNFETENQECLKEEKKITKKESFMKFLEEFGVMQQTDGLDDQNIREKLKNVPENELLNMIQEIESTNFYLSKENEVYEFIFNDDEILQSFLAKIEKVDKDISTLESFELAYPAKCYFAEKKLEHAEKVLKQKNADYALEIQNLNFKVESLNKSLKDLNETNEKFNKDIRLDGRHPVTKKIKLQKVAKYFDDSIRFKMDLANRYKIQIQGDIMEQNKILSQIKVQEKRLAFLDMTEFQEAQFDYKKSCKELAMYKEQLGKYKAKFSLLLQKFSKLKKDLEREESDMEKMKTAVIKLEQRKEVMLSEKVRNEEKKSELQGAMRKIRLDSRRHDLPEVIDYAVIKKENNILTKNVEKWKKKVEAIQQEKLLSLNALSKRRNVEQSS